MKNVKLMTLFAPGALLLFLSASPSCGSFVNALKSWISYQDEMTSSVNAGELMTNYFPRKSCTFFAMDS